MGALDNVEWEACVLEPVRNRDAERYLRRSLGMVPPGALYFVDSDWLTHGVVAFDLVHLPRAHVAPMLAELIALAVSQESSCRYCYAATRGVMKILGFSEARIRRLEEDSLGADLPSGERAAIEFARCVARAAPLATCRDGRPVLDAGYDPGAVKEIAVLVAVNVFYNRLSTLAALPPASVEGMADHWYMRIFRPFVARMVRPRPTAHGERLRPEQRVGHFAAFVNALDGLPAAPRIRAVIDEAWRSPALSVRLKALIFAVVARGMGCVAVEQEAAQMLADEGMSADDVAGALAHLSGATLAATDQAALALARESTFVRPAQVQRLARTVRAQFSRQQFVELIGLISLANAICRLVVVLDA